jgi:hypothetical protein
MFVLLQVYPPEAAGDEDECCCLDVIAVDASETELERYLAAYRYRYQAACKDFDAWDDMSTDWNAEHDHMCDELQDKYQVYGSLIQGTKFKILECHSGGRLVPECEPREPVLPPMAHG